jgi:hypothetical protein
MACKKRDVTNLLCKMQVTLLEYHQIVLKYQPFQNFSLSDDPKIPIKLKTELVGLDGKPLIAQFKISQLSQFENMTEKEINAELSKLTIKEYQKLVPKLTLGDGLNQILSNQIQPANNDEAAQLFSYINKINNKTLTSKAEWQVDKDELKKFTEFIDKAKQGINAIVNGQIKTILEELSAELVIKSQNKK